MIEKKEMLARSFAPDLAYDMEKYKEKVIKTIERQSDNWRKIGFNIKDATESVTKNLEGLGENVKACVGRSENIDEFRECLINLLPEKNTAFIIADFLIAEGRKKVNMIKKLNEEGKLIDV